MVTIALIGGSGVIPENFVKKEEVFPDTPYGKPSDPIDIGDIGGVEVAFLYRHGRNHQHPPTSVPYRANMYALKSLGVKYVISICAVGSLQEECKPGDLVIADQVIDFTKRRDLTYFLNDTVHISMPDPCCPYVSGVFSKVAEEMGIRHHDKGTYMCIEGPRFSTRAESAMFRALKGDIIGMTMIPEVNLARELGMCYCSLATITDYDCWKDEDVTIEMVFKTMAECNSRIQKLLTLGLPRIDAGDRCKCIEAARGCGSLEKFKF